MGIDLGRRSIVEWAANAPDDGAGEFRPAARRFVVEAPIGAGGLGEVYLVQDRDLRRQVAMKVLREEAARGVEGRVDPRESLEDEALAKCIASREGKSQPEPVRSFPTVASVYGMEDAAGNVWDWTDSWYDESRTLRVLRGGSWNNHPPSLRCAVGGGTVPGNRFPGIGFRCARGLGGL